ncbi:MAG TPA: hypothetical protein VJV23_16680 [Candidatus Polarisedimenticolia bacterium]|nr:hypothetical protein [Candidatus Polarisedimenticolia bacterium]
MTRTVEILQGMQNVSTPHRAEDYPGLLVVDPGEHWDRVIVPQPGEGFTAKGGEYVLGYRTAGGVEASPFVLRQGDRATKTRGDLPAFMAEWRVERAGPS